MISTPLVNSIGSCSNEKAVPLLLLGLVQLPAISISPLSPVFQTPFEDAGLFAVRVKLFQHDIAAAVYAAANVNPGSYLLVKICAAEFVALPNQLHLQSQRAANRAFEIFGLTGRRGAALRVLILLTGCCLIRLSLFGRC